MRRIASNMIDFDGLPMPVCAFAIDGDEVVNIYEFDGEVAMTEWLPKPIKIRRDSFGKAHAYVNGKILKEK